MKTCQAEVSPCASQSPSPPCAVTTPGGAVTGGVAISPDGMLQYRQVAPIARTTGKADQLYVSLPRALAAWKEAREAGKEPPADVRYLKGLTSIRNVFIFPEQHDIVLAGPAETYKADNPLQPVGTISGRPVVQLEDLIVAMRAITGRARGDFFGCSLDGPTNFNEVWEPTLKKYNNRASNALVEEMRKVLGPQQVKLYGVPEDSRLGFAMLAADYRLKRVAMGLETVPGLASALGTENAAPRIWFEPAYEPLLVSPDGNAYELKGARLKVLVGAQQFNPGGASEAQKKFAENLTKKIPEAAARIDAFADLQNITDCFMVAALIQQDKLAEKAGLDAAWIPDSTLATATVHTPKTAQTVVHISGNVIAQGGVAFARRAFTGTERDAAATIPTRADRPTQTWWVAAKQP